MILPSNILKSNELEQPSSVPSKNSIRAHTQWSCIGSRQKGRQKWCLQTLGASKIFEADKGQLNPYQLEALVLTKYF